MNSRLHLMPFLALTLFISTVASAELKPFCEGTCPAEMSSIMDSGLSKKLFDYDDREEAIETLTTIASKSVYQPVRLKGIEILKQTALNLNADIRIKALDAIATIAKGSANQQAEVAALNVLGTSADSSFVQLSLRTMQNIDEIASKSSSMEVKNLALSLLWEASWSKNKLKRDAAITSANNIAKSATTTQK